LRLFDLSARKHPQLRRLDEERGFALVLALGATIVLSALVVVAIDYATSNSRSTRYSEGDKQALSFAEAGLNDALSILTNAKSPWNSSVLPSTPTVDPNNSSVFWWGSYDTSTSVWTVYGRGVVRNPDGGSSITRTVSEQLDVPTTSSNPAWNYIYAYNSGCFTLDNSVQIAQPLYVAGNLCLNNSSRILSTASPVYVGGTIQTTSSATVGTSASPLDYLHVVGGCRYGTSGLFASPCGAAQQVYVNHQDSTVPTITKPPIDLSYWYANAQPGPQHACTSGSFPGGFDGDSTMNRSRADVDLFPGSSYDCAVVSGGQTTGEIAWNTATKVFTITGTVFFDGNIVMSGADSVTYTGRGTIYASGKINLSGSQTICAVRSGSACDWTTGDWDPDTTLLVLVAGSTTDTPDFTLAQSMMFQGAIYAATDYTQGNSVKQQGPIVANNMTIASSGQAKPMPFTTLAPGMPASAMSIKPGSWRSS
jgi:hypothetical protein